MMIGFVRLCYLNDASIAYQRPQHLFVLCFVLLFLDFCRMLKHDTND